MQKYFLFLFFVLWDINLLQSIDTHIMWLAFISYQQQTHPVFKFLIWNVNWKTQLVFITKHINANVVFCFNLTKIFLSYKKLNSIIIKIISKLFVILCNSLWIYFYWINMPNMHHNMLLTVQLDLYSQLIWLCNPLHIL